MDHNSFTSTPFDRLDAGDRDAGAKWIWHGYLARGNLTLLTSLWKAGKTTLLTGLLQRLAVGGDFLGQSCLAARALVVSEESPATWAERRQVMPVGPHAELLARPFRARPTPADWQALIDHALERRAEGRLDLFVVDTLAKFLPGHSDSDPGTILTMLNPLQELADSGVAVLVLHHPRKKPSEEGSTARGSGALLGYVDIILELHRPRSKKSPRSKKPAASTTRPTTSWTTSSGRRWESCWTIRMQEHPIHSLTPRLCGGRGEQKWITPSC